jgi:hypothetical protein
MQPIYRIIPLIVLVFFVSAQSAPFNIAVSYTPPYVYPGSLIQLYITLVSAQPLTNVYIDIDSPFKVVTGSTVQIQQLSAGVPYTAVAAVQVPLDARPGYYRIRVVAYTLLRSAEATLDVEVLPFDFSSLAVARPSAYVAGQSVQLPVLLFNPTVDYVKAKASISGGVVSQFLNATPTCDATIPPRSNATCVLNFALPASLKPGFYNATLTVTLNGVSGYAGSIVFNKTIQLPVVSGADINIAATPAQPPVLGTPTMVTLLITPGGAAPLQNVTVRVLDGEGVRILSKNTVKTPLLTQLQIPVQAVFTAYGVVRVPVEICYSTGACVVRYAEVYVPQPKISVNAYFNPPQVYPGSLAQVTLVVATNYTMAGVNIRVKTPFKILTGSSMELPAITPQTPITVNIVIEIPKEAQPGLYPLEVSVGDVNYTFYYEVVRPDFNVLLIFNPPLSYPGGLASGTLTVAAPFTAKNLTISIYTPLILASPGEYKVPYLPQGQPFTAYVTVQVPGNALAGRYPVVVSVNGVNYTFYLSVSRPEVAIQNIVVTPPRLLEGASMAQVMVQVINTGPVVARNVTVVLVNATVGRRSYTVDYLPPGSPVTLTYYLDVSKLSAGDYNVVAVARWSGGEYVAQGPLEIRKKDVLDIRYRIYNAAPGSTAVLIVNITNMGAEEAKNVKITMTPSQVFEPHASNIADVATAGTRVLGDIPPGGTATTAFLLDVSDKAVPGVYSLTLVVTWNQTGVFTPGVQYVGVPIEVRGGLDLFVVVPLALTILLLVVGGAIAARRRRRG